MGLVHPNLESLTQRLEEELQEKLQLRSHLLRCNVSCVCVYFESLKVLNVYNRFDVYKVSSTFDNDKRHFCGEVGKSIDLTDVVLLIMS